MKFQLEYLTVSISRGNPILHISLQGHHDVTLTDRHSGNRTHNVRAKDTYRGVRETTVATERQ